MKQPTKPNIFGTKATGNVDHLVRLDEALLHRNRERRHVPVVFRRTVRIAGRLFRAPLRKGPDDEDLVLPDGLVAARSPDADLHFDVADREEARRVLEADVEANGPYYGVVLNAGVAADAPFPALEGDAWDRVLRTDLDGFYNVLKPLVMPMVSARIRGRIVALSSVSGIAGNRGQVNYSAAKAGVIGAVKALAVELAKRGITVNAVAPGVIDTEMAASIEFQDEVRKAIPMRRFGTPEEVAAVVAFLFREDASYVTRQVISVNGGLV